MERFSTSGTALRVPARVTGSGVVPSGMDTVRIFPMRRAVLDTIGPSMQLVRRGVRILLDSDTGERVACAHFRHPEGVAPAGPWRAPRSPR